MSDEPNKTLAQRAAETTDWVGANQSLRERAAQASDWVGPTQTPADSVSDAAWSLPAAVNRGMDNTLNLIGLPARALANVFGANIPEARIFSRANADRRPETAAGRYADAVGEAIGSTVIPSAGVLGNAARLAALAPTTVPRAIGQQVGQAVTAAPATAVAADVLAATGSGVAQQGAQDAGFSPAVQATAGVLGGIAPFAPAAVYSGTRRAINSARANSDPHARVAASLGDQSLDDVASAIATGNTAIDPNISRRVLDTLGEEMVRAGGNRNTAVAETLRRLEIEGNVTPDAAREQLRRVTASQSNSELMFGEYPTVTQSNLDTRGLQHSPEALEALRILGVDAVQNINPRAKRANATRLVNELGINRKMANQRLTAARGVLEDERAAGNIQDSGAQWLTDYLANSGAGASSQLVRNAIHERTPAMQAQARDVLRGMSPNRQTIEDADDLVAAMIRQASQEYNVVHNTPGAVNYNLLHGPNGNDGLVQRTLERHLQRAYGRNDDQADALREAINRFYVSRPPSNATARSELPLIQDDLAATRMHIREARRQGVDKETIDNMNRMADALAESQRLTRRELNPNTQQTIAPTLRQIQDARTGVWGQIAAARAGSRDDIANLLTPLYRDMTRIMERSSPQWRVANRRWADMNIAERAQDLGNDFALQANPRYREQLAEFRAMAPEAQDLVRVHFVQKLLDRIANPGETHDLAKLFSTPHIRTAVRTILGDDAAMALSRFIRDQRVTTKSKGMLSGSQTHARGQRQNEQDADLGILASVESASVGGFRKWLMDKTVNILRERRNKPLAKIVTTPIRDTAAVAEHLERMRGARELAARYANPGIRQRGLPGRYGPIVAPFTEDN